MSNQKLIYIMSAIFVCILFTAMGFFIHDRYMERNFVPAPDLVREPVPPQSMPPRKKELPHRHCLSGNRPTTTQTKSATT